MIVVEPSAVSLPPIIEKEVEVSEWFDSPLEKMVKKMIASDGTQKIDAPSAKPVRQFLTRQLLKLNNSLVENIENAKKDFHKC